MDISNRVSSFGPNVLNIFGSPPNLDDFPPAIKSSVNPFVIG